MDQSAAAVAFAAAKNLLISLSPLPTRVLEKRRERDREKGEAAAAWIIDWTLQAVQFV